MTRLIGRSAIGGFTLVEIMVALIIFAVMSVTLLVRLGDNIRAEQSLETRTLAMLVAENTLAEMRAQREWSAVRDDNRTVSLAGSNWRVNVTVENTEEEFLRRVDVHVGPDSGSGASDPYIVRLTTFIGRY